MNFVKLLGDSLTLINWPGKANMMLDCWPDWFKEVANSYCMRRPGNSRYLLMNLMENMHSREQVVYSQGKAQHEKRGINMLVIMVQVIIDEWCNHN